MKTKDMILVSMFATLMIVGAFLKIQIGVIPFTFQFFFCAFSGIFLGAKKGALSQLVYMLIGLVGIPVFANGGGLSYVFQPSFGFITGFIACAFVIGLITEKMVKLNFIKLLGATLAGLTTLYVIGVPYLYMIIKLYMGKSDFTFTQAIAAGFTPFILPDIILSIVATVVSLLVLPKLKAAGYLRKNNK